MLYTYDWKNRDCSVSKFSQAWLWLALPLFIAALTLTSFFPSDEFWASYSKHIHMVTSI